MANGITFTAKAAAKIRKATEIVLRTPQRRPGERTAPITTDQTLWAIILGNDVTGMRYSFVRVYPNASTDEADFVLGRDLAYTISSDERETGWARESSGYRHVPHESIVKLEFVGHDRNDEAAFLFQYVGERVTQEVPIHDHRDQLRGGFSFSVYHPGTDLPQMPWAT